MVYCQLRVLEVVGSNPIVPTTICAAQAEGCTRPAIAPQAAANSRPPPPRGQP